MMHRTQVYFEPEILEILRKEASERKTTIAHVIREKVEKDMKKQKIKMKKKDAAAILGEIAELGKKLGIKGPRDLSQRIDEFVYQT